MQMAFEGSVKISNFIVQQWPAWRTSCIVDEDVDWTAFFNQSLSLFGDGFRVFKVQNQHSVLTLAKGFQILNKSLQGLSISGTDSDVCARLGQQFCSR
jgi:DNA polymerase III delta subunit